MDEVGVVMRGHQKPMEIDFKVRFKSEDVEDSSNNALSMRLPVAPVVLDLPTVHVLSRQRNDGGRMSDKKVTGIIVLVADMYLDPWECRHQVYIHDPPARITAT